jgi:hypothetical protein
VYFGEHLLSMNTPRKEEEIILWSLLKNERDLMPRDLTPSNIPLTLKE